MSNPETGREVSPAAQGNSDAAGRQIKSLVLGAAAVIIVMLAVGGFALYRHAGVIDGKLRALQASMNDLKARVERGNVVGGGAATGIVSLLNEQAKTEKTLARIETAATAKPPPPPLPPPPAPAIVLTADDLAVLRTFFKLAAAGEPAQYNVGDRVPADAVKPVPAEVTGRIAPGLEGANYLIDKNGALVVTTGADNVVVLVVAPA